LKTSIGVQLWSVRDLLEKDFKGTLKRISKIGYKGVELAGFYGMTPKEPTKLFKELGLTPLGIHHGLSTEKENRKTFQKAKALGIKKFVAPWLDPQTFKDPKKIEAFCDTVNQASKVAREYGLSVGFHNHNGEFEKDNGKVRFETLMKLLDPKVFFEVDTYWVLYGGQDPAKWVGRLGKRAPLLHLKDGPGKGEHKEPNVALGEGVVDFPAIVKAGGKNLEWLIVEFDNCATDIMEGLEKSYQYLVDQGWAKKKRRAS